MTNQHQPAPWRVPRRGLVMLAAAGGSVLISGCVAASASPAAPAEGGPSVAGVPEQAPSVKLPQGETRTSEAGQVTLAVTWLGRAQPSSEVAFTVVMDTHVVDLDGFDLRQLAVLRTDAGTEARPSGWQSPKGGHHREGKLTFPAIVGDRAMLGPGTRQIELIVRDVAAPERRFTWPL